ncbi:MAG TPA: metal-sulfur cluster assembly factor [Kofleriaceae bacterium]|nr:metal-sulfur cluster assembly factor [Kofleriaceae bacterium]
MRDEAAAPNGVGPREPEVLAALGRCHDPCCKEKQISVVDMGLVERVRIDGDRVDVDLVLTSGWCPFSMHLLTMVEQEVGAIEGVGEVVVNITWDRVWTPERLSEDARAKLRLPMEQLLPLREARLRREAAERAKNEPRTSRSDETGESR